VPRLRINGTNRLFLLYVFVGWTGLYLCFFKNRCNVPPVHSVLFNNTNNSKPTNTPYGKNVYSVQEGGTYSNHWLLKLSALAMGSGYRCPSRRHLARQMPAVAQNLTSDRLHLGTFVCGQNTILTLSANMLCLFISMVTFFFFAFSRKQT
jgi:hypothetical protein